MHQTPDHLMGRVIAERCAAEQSTTEIEQLRLRNARLVAEVCKQVAGSHVVFDREIVDYAKAGLQNALTLISANQEGKLMNEEIKPQSKMRELKVGDKLKDNDTRMYEHRVLTIVELLPNGVVAEDSTGKRRMYLRKRIHTDGKPRKSGLNLVTAANEGWLAIKDMNEDDMAEDGSALFELRLEDGSVLRNANYNGANCNGGFTWRGAAPPLPVVAWREQPSPPKDSPKKIPERFRELAMQAGWKDEPSPQAAFSAFDLPRFVALITDL